ncbi:MAG: hypothetical protein H7125_18870, partial [Proteobacteria bacterium]|nr:hypothetical protein [Burkholderiales bacterium]
MARRSNRRAAASSASPEPFAAKRRVAHPQSKAKSGSPTRATVAANLRDPGREVSRSAEAGARARRDADHDEHLRALLERSRSAKPVRTAIAWPLSRESLAGPLDAAAEE